MLPRLLGVAILAVALPLMLYGGNVDMSEIVSNWSDYARVYEALSKFTFPSSDLELKSAALFFGVLGLFIGLAQCVLPMSDSPEKNSLTR